MIKYAQSSDFLLNYRSAFNPNGNFTNVCTGENYLNCPFIIVKEDISALMIKTEINKPSSIDKDSTLAKIFSDTSTFGYSIFPNIIKVFVPSALLKDYKIYPDTKYNVIRNCSIITIMNIDVIKFQYLLPLIGNYFKMEDAYELSLSRQDRLVRLIIPSEYTNRIVNVIHQELIEKA